MGNKDFRIDSDFWTKQPKINPALKYGKIGNFLISSQYGISIEMNEHKVGYPIYRMNEIHNMLCDFEVSKYADISKSEFDIFKLEDRDVLFNRTNSYEWVGRTGIYRKTKDCDYTFASYLVRFVPDQKFILPEYLSAFLNTKYGIWDVKRRARQSINQTNVNPEEVKQIDIPLFSLDLQNLIKENFDSAINLLQKSQQLYIQAEQFLLDELGLRDWRPSTENINSKSFKESFLTTGRLDAEYYQPKYDEIEDAFSKYEQITLNDLVTYPISSGITPKAGGDDYTIKEFGIPFVRAVDLIDGEVSANNFNYIKKTVHDGILKRTKLKNNDVLFSIAGTVGRCAIFNYNFEANINQAICILRFQEEKVMRLYLVLFFNSSIGKEYVSKYARQGLQTNLNLEEVGALNIPMIDYLKQKKISKLVQQSFTLNHQSEQLLEVAKRSVEIGIEENESAAMEYINQKHV